MSKLLVAIVALLAVGCMHTHQFDIQGHQITQLRSYDLIGPSTVGYYEDVDGKLVLHQQAAGSNLGEIAIGVGTGYAGERIGDGLKHQEPDSIDIANEATGGKGGAATGGSATGGDATGGSATGGNATGGRASVGPVNSVSGAAAGAISNSTSRVTNPAVRPSVKPAVKPVSVKKPATTNQSVSVKNTINQ